LILDVQENPRSEIMKVAGIAKVVASERKQKQKQKQNQVSLTPICHESLLTFTRGRKR
jgi:hypothetical protein